MWPGRPGFLRGAGDGHRTRFLVADATAAALATSSVDAVMSIDALQLIPDRAAVFANVERVLKPGRRFAFATWVARRHGEGPPFPVDYSPLLTAAGLVSVVSLEPPQWEERESAVFALIRQNGPRLREEVGDSVATLLLSEAEKMPGAYPYIRRVNVVARKPDWESGTRWPVSWRLSARQSRSRTSLRPGRAAGASSPAPARIPCRRP